jgi:NADH:ubiquinone oxidoreductase subunit H
MEFNWKFLVPVSIFNVLVIAGFLKLAQGLGLTPSPEQATDLIANIPQTVVLLIGNLVVVAFALWLVRILVRHERVVELEQVQDDRAHAAAGD